MQDVLFRLAVSVIPLNKLWNLEQVHKPTGEWVKQLNKIRKFWDFSEASWRLSGSFPVFHRLFGYDKENGNVYVMI